MALTMTRTRTQSTLNKFVDLVANINGEQEFLAGLLGQEHPEGVRERLLARQVKLEADKATLFETILQLDPGLEPGRIGALPTWQRNYGSRKLSPKTLVARYVKSHAPS